jgi:hypothetical protein
MSTTHRLLFGASITMFFISVAHLGLVIQQVTVDRTLGANYKAQIIIAVFQVCSDAGYHFLHPYTSILLQFVIGDLILIWRSVFVNWYIYIGFEKPM